MSKLFLGILIGGAGLYWHLHTIDGNVPGSFNFVMSAVVAGIGAFLICLGIAITVIQD